MPGSETLKNTDLLAGVRVLDLSQYIPGPYATHQMVCLGADVIKLEPPFGDPLKHLFRPNTECVSPLYQHLNAGKKVLTVDLKTSSGRETLENLIGQADVMLDGWRPGVLAGLGFDREQIEMMNSRLVYCGLSGYGQTGPYSLMAGHDVGYCAMAGLYDMYELQPRLNIPFPPIADHVGAIQAVNAILAALLNRHRTGNGCWLDISLYETIFSWQYVNRQPQMRSLLGGGAAYYNMYRTADNRILTLGAIEMKFWTDFCEAAQQPRWINRYDEPLPQSNLIADVSAVIESEPLDFWLEVFKNVDCCLEAIPLSGSLLDHPQARARGIVGQSEIKYPGLINDQPTPGLEEFRDISIDANFKWENL